MQELTKTLIDLYLFDLWVFSQWWLYAPLMVPFAFYFTFFLFKWLVLTLPIWVALGIWKVVRFK